VALLTGHLAPALDNGVIELAIHLVFQHCRI
jgi:hypothetical protein